ncbi:MAG: NAD-dependent succinate-semialdehyde dehydrogenase [Longimicrobiales bacterium]|nr:NAD-dependent succinate-semialdehyde dehydrogenase [Longimicrobiales bacterium]
MSFEVVDPATGEARESRPLHTADEVERILGAAVDAQAEWARRSFDDRARALTTAADRLRGDTERWARRMTTEMGKPIAQARSEVEKCAWVCEYYADHGEGFLAPHTAETDATAAYWTPRPLGVVLGIMPWNFPHWQVFRFAAPTLMAGNGVLLKHAPNVPGCAEDISEIFAASGFAEGLFANLRLEPEAISEWMADDRIAAVTLTGSVQAGRAVAARAGELVKKSVLELGGSDPYVILEDADLDHAAERCVTSRMVNAGQSCIAAKRFIVLDAVHDAFVERVVALMSDYEIGDPHNDDTRLGPLARLDLRDEVHRQVQASVEAGARCLLGGEIPDRPGAWYPATVLTGVTPGMPAGSEEVFGPVASVLRAPDEATAIAWANGTRYGLGAAVFTADRERGETIARGRLHAGACFVNDFVRSDPRLPFGGVRESGYGRELSPLGIHEFVNQKTVWVR